MTKHASIVHLLASGLQKVFLNSRRSLLWQKLAGFVVEALVSRRLFGTKSRRSFLFWNIYDK